MFAQESVMDIQEKQALQKLINEMHDVTGMWSVEQMVTHVWQAAKAQAVQSKQDLLDRVNARWQLAHEQCAENWNTYSSAQMQAFDWVEQDIEEFLGEAQEPAND